MDDDFDGMHARLTLTGEIHLLVPPASEAVLTRVEATFGGDFGEPAAPFKLKLEGKTDELRKLGAMSPAILALLPLAADTPGEKAGTLTLRAPPAHLHTLRDAARGTPPMDANALLANVAFMTALFALDQYDAVSIGTIERWTEP